MRPPARRSRNQEGCQGLRTPDSGLRVKPWFAGRESGLAWGPGPEVRSPGLCHPAQDIRAKKPRLLVRFAAAWAAALVGACGDRTSARKPADDELTIVVQADKSRVAAQEAALEEQRKQLGAERDRLRKEAGRLSESKESPQAKAQELVQRAVQLVRDQEEFASRRERLVEERDVLVQKALSPTSTQLAERERQLTLREAGLAEREKDLASREAALAGREAALAQREAQGDKLAHRPAEKAEPPARGAVERAYKGLVLAMEQRGVVAADLAPAQQKALLDAAGFRGGGDLARSMAAIESLEASVGALSIDGEFVARKVQRVDALARSGDAKGREDVGRLLQEVARAYSDGRYSEANRALNRIILLLDRPRGESP
jgi:hypothetical protein